jgi:hypothetical protein
VSTGNSPLVFLGRCDSSFELSAHDSRGSGRWRRCIANERECKVSRRLGGSVASDVSGERDTRAHTGHDGFPADVTAAERKA